MAKSKLSRQTSTDIMHGDLPMSAYRLKSTASYFALHNRFSLMDALDRIKNIITNGREKPGRPMALAICTGRVPSRTVNPFSVALRMGAARERLMLSSRRVGIEGALEKPDQGDGRNEPHDGPADWSGQLPDVPVHDASDYLPIVPTWCADDERRPEHPLAGMARELVACPSGFRNTGFWPFPLCRHCSLSFICRSADGKDSSAPYSTMSPPGRCTVSSSA